MKTISRYIMTLALLITAVGGAWAAETTVTWVTEDFFNTGSAAFTKYDVTVTPSNNDARHSNFFYANGANTFTTTLGNFTKIEIVFRPSSSPLSVSGWNYELIEAVQPEPEYEPNYWQYTSKLTWTGDAESVSIQGLVESILSITFTIAKPDVEVTTNAAEEGATFTEATFAMPAFDATAEYVIVRDMAQQMTTKVGDGEEGFNIVVKKNEQGEGYVPAEMTPQAMAGLITVTDDMEEKDLTIMTDYTVEIFAADTDGKPTGDAIAFADLTPGTYVAVATGIDLYDGTAVSNTFALVEECDLTLSPAQSDKVESITVDGTAVTPDENGVIKKIKPGKKVVLKVNSPDYIIRKATLKKTVASANTITIGDITLDVEGCETWQNVIEKNSEKISSFASFAIKDNSYSDNQSGMKVLKLGDDFVVPSNPLDLSKTYTWTVIVPE